MTAVAQPWGAHTHLVLPIVAGARPDSVPNVIDKLGELQGALCELNERGAENPVASFNVLYRTITEQIQEWLTAGSFEDPRFLAELDVQFALLYLDALTNWTHNRHEAVPDCWRELFSRWNDADVAPILGAMTGVNCHIMRDLPHALINTFEKLDQDEGYRNRRRGIGPKRRSVQHRDYLKVNEIFHQQIPTLSRQLTRDKYYTRLYDLLNGPEQYRFEDLLVDGARDLAWDESRMLWHFRGIERGFDAVSESLDFMATRLAEVILSGAAEWAADAPDDDEDDEAGGHPDGLPSALPIG